MSDIPVVGRIFSHSQKTTEQTDIILTLTPHIIRVLDLTAEDLRPFRVGRDGIVAAHGAADADRAAQAAGAAEAGRRVIKKPGGDAQTQSGAALSVAADRGPDKARRLQELRHVRAQPLQPLHQPAVAPLHRFERRQLALPFSRQRSRDQRHA